MLTNTGIVCVHKVLVNMKHNRTLPLTCNACRNMGLCFRSTFFEKLLVIYIYLTKLAYATKHNKQ